MYNFEAVFTILRRPHLFFDFRSVFNLCVLRTGHQTQISGSSNHFGSDPQSAHKKRNSFKRRKLFGKNLLFPPKQLASRYVLKFVTDSCLIDKLLYKIVKQIRHKNLKVNF